MDELYDARYHRRVVRRATIAGTMTRNAAPMQAPREPADVLDHWKRRPCDPGVDHAWVHAKTVTRSETHK